MLKKLQGEKFALRHLTPEVLASLKNTLRDQLEVVHSAKRAKLVSNLAWPEPQEDFTPLVTLIVHGQSKSKKFL